MAMGALSQPSSMSNSFMRYGWIMLSLGILAAGRVFTAGFFPNAFLDFILLFMIPASFILLSGRRLHDFLLSFGSVKRGLAYSAAIFALAVPFMVYGSGLDSFRGYYPLWKPAYGSLSDFLLYELAVAVMLFSTEFFYRGFLLGFLKEKTRHGNIIHAVIYSLMHLGKPMLEVPYSFFAGFVFGEIDVRCRSILPSFLMHFLGNLFFDLLFIYAGASG
ncbi:MAG: type II CAAX endopeptidase family protein [Candidatus Altiarchaeota archaeon]|nr:type II CAAX endopeptidase family protein [Candidatus Altiarchaeota archaeon]